MLVGSPLMPFRLLLSRRDLEQAESDRAILFLFDQTRSIDWVEFIHAAPFPSVDVLSSLRMIPFALREKSYRFPTSVSQPFVLFQLNPRCFGEVQKKSEGMNCQMQS